MFDSLRLNFLYLPLFSIDFQKKEKIVPQAQGREGHFVPPAFPSYEHTSIHQVLLRSHFLEAAQKSRKALDCEVNLS